MLYQERVEIVVYSIKIKRMSKNIKKKRAKVIEKLYKIIY